MAFPTNKIHPTAHLNKDTRGTALPLNLSDDPSIKNVARAALKSMLSTPRTVIKAKAHDRKAWFDQTLKEAIHHNIRENAKEKLITNGDINHLVEGHRHSQASKATENAVAPLLPKNEKAIQQPRLVVSSSKGKENLIRFTRYAALLKEPTLVSKGWSSPNEALSRETSIPRSKLATEANLHRKLDFVKEKLVTLQKIRQQRTDAFQSHHFNELVESNAAAELQSEQKPLHDGDELSSHFLESKCEHIVPSCHLRKFSQVEGPSSKEQEMSLHSTELDVSGIPSVRKSPPSADTQADYDASTIHLMERPKEHADVETQCSPSDLVNLTITSNGETTFNCCDERSLAAKISPSCKLTAPISSGVGNILRLDGHEPLEGENVKQSTRHEKEFLSVELVYIINIPEEQMKFEAASISSSKHEDLTEVALQHCDLPQVALSDLSEGPSLVPFQLQPDFAKEHCFPALDIEQSSAIHLFNTKETECFSPQQRELNSQEPEYLSKFVAQQTDSPSFDSVESSSLREDFNATKELEGKKDECIRSRSLLQQGEFNKCGAQYQFPSSHASGLENSSHSQQNTGSKNGDCSINEFSVEDQSDGDLAKPDQTAFKTARAKATTIEQNSTKPFDMSSSLPLDSPTSKEHDAKSSLKRFATGNSSVSTMLHDHFATSTNVTNPFSVICEGYTIINGLNTTPNSDNMSGILDVSKRSITSSEELSLDLSDYNHENLHWPKAELRIK